MIPTRSSDSKLLPFIDEPERRQAHLQGRFDSSQFDLCASSIRKTATKPALNLCA